MTINERIKEARKAKGYSQRKLAVELGVAQTSISFMEKEGNTVPDKNIKSICLLLGLNENWLRNGIEPMFIQPETFSLDQFTKERGMTDNDLKIVKAYFELEPEVRNAVINFFKNAIVENTAENETAAAISFYDEAPKTPEELEQQYPPKIDNEKAETG